MFKAFLRCTQKWMCAIHSLYRYVHMTIRLLSSVQFSVVEKFFFFQSFSLETQKEKPNKLSVESLCHAMKLIFDCSSSPYDLLSHILIELRCKQVKHTLYSKVSIFFSPLQSQQFIEFFFHLTNLPLNNIIYNYSHSNHPFSLFVSLFDLNVNSYQYLKSSKPLKIAFVESQVMRHQILVMVEHYKVWIKHRLTTLYPFLFIRYLKSLCHLIALNLPDPQLSGSQIETTRKLQQQQKEEFIHV